MLHPTLKPNAEGIKYWKKADVIGLGQNKVVIGNKIHDVTFQHPDTDNSSSYNIIWPWTFGIAIACYSDSNALVANNLISKSTTSKQTTLVLNGDKLTVPYPMDNHYGIDVNSIMLGGPIFKYLSNQRRLGQGSLNPSCYPWYFRRGLVIRGNYVYMNGWVGMTWSVGEMVRQLDQGLGYTTIM